MRAALPAGVLLILGVCIASSARAGERELTLALTPVYSVIHWDQREPGGGGLASDLTLGLSEAFSARATAFFTAHPASAAGDALPKGTIWTGGVFLGLDYAFDVLRLVPFLDMGLGALVHGSEEKRTSADFGVEVGVGADYLVTRGFSLGVMLRYYAFITSIRDIPVYLYVGPRLAWRWN
jgi:hypothetical protein